VCLVVFVWGVVVLFWLILGVVCVFVVGCVGFGFWGVVVDWGDVVLGYMIVVGWVGVVFGVCVWGWGGVGVVWIDFWFICEEQNDE
jgi:hypothetical protein